MTDRQSLNKTDMKPEKEDSAINLPGDKSFFTIAETAQILKLARITVYRRLRVGEISYVRMGKRILIPASFFHSLMQSSSHTTSNVQKKETPFV